MIGTFDVAAQILIAMALVYIAWSQHSTTIKIEQIHRIHGWGNRCLDIFSECEHIVEFHINKDLDNDNFLSKKFEIMKELSSLINQGRLFYGNAHKEEYGCEKYPAYQGYRPVILDPLVALYGAMSSVGKDKSVLEAETLDKICDWRKFYLSLLQEDINSTWLMKRVSAHTIEGIPGYAISGKHSPPSPPSWKQYKKSRQDITMTTSG